TESYFDKYGGMTIVVSRFIPIVRTFAPFVAGIGHMAYARFQGYNIIGGLSWGMIFIWGGFLFGNIPLIKNKFRILTIVIIIVSVMPAVFAMLKSKRDPNPG